MLFSIWFKGSIVLLRNLTKHIEIFLIHFKLLCYMKQICNSLNHASRWALKVYGVLWGARKLVLGFPFFVGWIYVISFLRQGQHSPIAFPSQVLEFQACSTAPSLVLWVFMLFLLNNNVATNIPLHIFL